MTLAGTVALVTGASGGIGGALARRLAAEGADLVLSGRDSEKLQSVAAAVRELGSAVETMARDLTEEGAVDELAGIAEAGRELDLVLHALGSYSKGRIEDSPVGELDRQLDVNLRVPWALTRRLLPGLRRRGGQIVFVNSSVGVAARGGVGAYAASKHALRALADSLREEVNPDGVRVLTVYPGRTASAMQREVRRLEGLPYLPERLLQPEDVAAMVVAALALPRTAEVTELTIRPLQKP